MSTDMMEMVGGSSGYSVYALVRLDEDGNPTNDVRGYVVVDPEGRVVSGIFIEYEDAYSFMDDLIKRDHPGSSLSPGM